MSISPALCCASHLFHNVLIHGKNSRHKITHSLPVEEFTNSHENSQGTQPEAMFTDRRAQVVLSNQTDIASVTVVLHDSEHAHVCGHTGPKWKWSSILMCEPNFFPLKLMECIILHWESRIDCNLQPMFAGLHCTVWTAKQRCSELTSFPQTKYYQLIAAYWILLS